MKAAHATADIRINSITKWTQGSLLYPLHPPPPISTPKIKAKDKAEKKEDEIYRPRKR